VGSVPKEFRQLDHLVRLYVNHNSLTCVLPKDISLLHSTLEELYTQHNPTDECPIPSEIGQLTALKRWENNNNPHTNLPTEVGMLSALTQLFMHKVPLEGSLPTELGELSALRLWSNYETSLSGSLPTELGELTALREMRLFRSQFTGCVPTELGMLTQLLTLQLYDNHLRCSLPGDLDGMAALKRLDVSTNSLTGCLPTSIKDMPNLRALALHHNQLSCSIPPSYGTFAALKDLRLHHNSLAGTIPAQLAGLGLETLLLHENALTGTIPASFATGCQLSHLQVQLNSLSGVLPDLSDCPFPDPTTSAAGVFKCWLTECDETKVTNHFDPAVPAGVADVCEVRTFQPPAPPPSPPPPDCDKFPNDPACGGNQGGGADTNHYVVITSEHDMTLEEFDEGARVEYASGVARVANVDSNQVTLEAAAGSIIVTATIQVADAASAAVVSALLAGVSEDVYGFEVGLPVLPGSMSVSVVAPPTAADPTANIGGVTGGGGGGSSTGGGGGGGGGPSISDQESTVDQGDSMNPVILGVSGGVGALLLCVCAVAARRWIYAAKRKGRSRGSQGSGSQDSGSRRSSEHRNSAMESGSRGRGRRSGSGSRDGSGSKGSGERRKGGGKGKAAAPRLGINIKDVQLTEK